MGRYYNGDIEGKFWVGIQPSTDADFFGVIHEEVYYKKCGCEAIEKCSCEEQVHVHEDGCDSNTCTIEFDDASVYGEPSCVKYSFKEKDLEDVKEGISICDIKLGKYKEKLDTYFNKANVPKVLCEYLEVSSEKTKDLEMWYARYELGVQILDCIVEKGQCNFICEL
jgi:hypothetical protein